MARVVREIMNPELFSLRPAERARDALRYLLALGITGAPVLDDKGRPIGFVSLRDLLVDDDTVAVDGLMSAPAASISADADLEAVADLLCEDNLHHVACVDAQGRAVGFVGSLDVLRGIRGNPVPHPKTFPHWDPSTGLCWSDQIRLDVEHVRDECRDAAGLYVLIKPGSGEEDRVVWSEAVVNVRDRLLRMLEVPREAPPHLADLVTSGKLWFRCAVAPSVLALTEAIRPRHA